MNTNQLKEATVIQVDQKAHGHHPLVLLVIDNPKRPYKRNVLRMYTDLNQYNVDNGIKEQANCIGGPLGGFIKQL